MSVCVSLKAIILALMDTHQEFLRFFLASLHNVSRPDCQVLDYKDKHTVNGWKWGNDNPRFDSLSFAHYSINVFAMLACRTTCSAATICINAFLQERRYNYIPKLFPAKTSLFYRDVEMEFWHNHLAIVFFKSIFVNLRRCRSYFLCFAGE